MISKKKVTIEVGDGAAIPRKKDRGIVDAWWLSFIGAIVVISYLCLAKPEPYLRILKFVFGEIKVPHGKHSCPSGTQGWESHSG